MTDTYQADLHAGITADWRDMPPPARHLVPAHLRGGLDAYVEQRIRPGHFLCAVLSNDLAQAVGRADDQSLAGLRDLMSVLHTYAPGTCHGSPKKVREWLEGAPR